MKPIPCNLHDYVEIACLYRYDVQLALLDETIIEGQARTTLTQKNQFEIMQLTSDQSLMSIPLHEIAQMEVLTPNARFSHVDFAT